MAPEEEPGRTRASAKPSVLERFLAARNLQPTAVPSSPKRAGLSAVSLPRNAPVRGGSGVGVGGVTATSPVAVWKRCTKRAHGERVAALRAAMRTPDDVYSNSRDAYNPKKPPLRFVQLHAEEAVVSADFRVLTRAMFFQREKVDRDVCDRLENRQLYDARLLELYSHDDDANDCEQQSPRQQQLCVGGGTHAHSSVE